MKFLPRTDNATKMFLVCVSALCYLNSLLCGLVFDDWSAIRDNKDVLPSSPVSNMFLNDFWGVSMQAEQSHKSYRPLCVLSFRLNYLLHGLSPLGYHLVNLQLHVVATLLFSVVTSHYVSPDTSTISALIFAVHSVHTEAVTGVVGRAELLSAIFFLLSLQLYQKSHSLSSALTCGLAMLSKEVGLTVIGLCIIHEVVVTQNIHKAAVRRELPVSFTRRTWWRLLALLVSLAVLLALRLEVVQGSSLPVFTRFDNPASQATGLTRHLTLSLLPCLNLGLLLCPARLCCDWTMASIPLLTSFADIRILWIILTLVTALSLLYTAAISSDKYSKQILFAAAWLVIPFIPASNVFFPVGFVIAERVLYIPSMGFCLLVSIGFKRIFQQFSNARSLLVCLLSLLVVALSARTVSRNFDWIDEKSLFLSGLKVNKVNAKLYNNLGHALESEKKYQEALVLFKEAAVVQPDDIGAHINIGRTYNLLQQYQEAELAYRSAKRLLPRAPQGGRKVVRIAPNSLNLFLNLGNLIARNSSCVECLEEADSLYRQAIAMRSDFVQAYINRGDVLLRLNRTKEALNIYHEALKIDNNNPDIHYNLAVVALEQKKPKEGLQYLNKALEIQPNHPESLLNSAIVIQELGLNSLKPLATQRLLKLKEIQPENERIYFNLAMLSTDEDNVVEAEAWFNEAIKLKPDFRSALFNLALLLADNNRPLEALEPLEQLLHHFPQHVKALILMGDIYTNHKKDLATAESCYRRYVSGGWDGVD